MIAPIAAIVNWYECNDVPTQPTIPRNGIILNPDSLCYVREYPNGCKLTYESPERMLALYKPEQRKE